MRLLTSHRRVTIERFIRRHISTHICVSIRRQIVPLATTTLRCTILRFHLGRSNSNSVHPQRIGTKEERIGLLRVVVNHRGTTCKEGFACLIPPLAIVGKADNLLRSIVHLDISSTDDMSCRTIILDRVAPHLTIGRQ